MAGDLLLDHYITGSTERTSPEAPVPVVLVDGESYAAGGAANVARNIAEVSSRVTCTGIIGDDVHGRQLLSELDAAGVDAHTVVASRTFPTIIKTRVVSQGQQIVRLDHEKPWVPNEEDLEKVLRAIDGSLADIDAVIVSDYGKGYLAADVLQYLLTRAAALKIPVFVDPKGRDFSRYKGAYAITPNAREAQEATGISTATHEGLKAAAEALYKVTGCPLVAITLGPEGLAVYRENSELFVIPTSAQEVFDVTGAGDTLVAWLTLSIVSGLKPRDAAYLANMAAGISVARIGPATVSALDMRQALVPGRLGKKIIREDDLETLGTALHDKGRRIILAVGCFDYLHAGHVSFLQQAKDHGDVLVVATHEDETITRLKGSPRPIIRQGQREELLASIESVDYVVAFKGETPRDIIAALKPDVFVKGDTGNAGDDYDTNAVTEAGGAIVTIPILYDFHTEHLVRGMEEGE